ncbi:MAG: hypothetical protein AAB482_01185 [Patescibacteria group bacterium]
MIRRIVFGLLMFLVLLASVSVVDAGERHGRHSNRGHRYGRSYHYSYGYQVPAYRPYYYALAPVYGPPVVHHPGILDYIIVLPLRALFGHDEVVQSPQDRQDKRAEDQGVDEEDPDQDTPRRTPEGGW